MCGRYNFTAEEAADIRDIIQQVQQKLRDQQVRTGEIYPTNFVPVLVPGTSQPEPVAMTWGFPNFASKSKSAVVINARSETVLEKRMFQKSVLSRRCVVPSTGFFEWDRYGGENTKYLFRQPGRKALYMAGIWNAYRDADGVEKQRFVILTTAANQSMKADTHTLSLFPEESAPARLIHDRMPIILEPEEREEWLSNDVDFDKLFNRESIILEHAIA